MELIQVELKKTKFFAYPFDGSEQSAKEFCRKFGLHYQTDFMDKEKFSITLPNNKRVYAGNYVVVDGHSFQNYTQTEFIQTFNVVPDHYQRSYSFMSED
jgi:hypothetical protein